LALTLASGCSFFAGSAVAAIQILPPVSYACTNASQLATGDFNADGKLDLAVASSDGYRIFIFTNAGNGTLVASINFATSGSSRAIVTGRFDADAHLDVAVVMYPGENVTMWPGTSLGTFGNPKLSGVLVNYSAPGLAAGDVNNDGKLDLVLETYGPRILLGQGNGYFTSLTNYSVGGSGYAVALGHLNSDTNLDFVTANYSYSSMSVGLGDGTGYFPTRTNYSGAFSEYHLGVALADFNNDGSTDLATINQYAGTVDSRLNNGDGSFGPALTSAVMNSPVSISTADFDGDQRQDIVVQTSSSIGPLLGILRGMGDGTFAPRQTNIVQATFAGIANQSLVVADFNGDGRPDIATTRHQRHYVSVLLNDTAWPVQLAITSDRALRFRSYSGQHYTVQYASSLTANSWTNLPGGGLAGTGGDLTVWDTNEPPVEVRYYRVLQD
jgi:hypothetical protein